MVNRRESCLRLVLRAMGRRRRLLERQEGTNGGRQRGSVDRLDLYPRCRVRLLSVMPWSLAAAGGLVGAPLGI